MSGHSLIMFMGTEYGGLYQITNLLEKAGIKAGIPRKSLENFPSLRNSNIDTLHYWQIIRRFFDDLGLPPIAEPPATMINSQQIEYIVGAMARTLAILVNNSSFICADHLTALLLPYVKQACSKLKVPVKYYFFYSDPAKEIAEMQYTRGIPTPLSEYTWRNIVASAGRQSPASLRFINTDSLNNAELKKIVEEICTESGINYDLSLECGAWESLSPANIVISPLTEQLYSALNSNDPVKLFKTATENYTAFAAQDGWQFLDGLDNGILDQQCKRLLSHANHPTIPDNNMNMPIEIPDNEKAWFALLDECERKLLKTRQDYEEKLFLNTSAAQRYYALLYAEQKKNLIMDYSLAAERQRKLQARYKARIRKLFDKMRSAS